MPTRAVRWPVPFTSALKASRAVMWIGLAILAIGMIGVTLRLQGPVTNRVQELRAAAIDPDPMDEKM